MSVVRVKTSVYPATEGDVVSILADSSICDLQYHGKVMKTPHFHKPQCEQKFMLKILQYGKLVELWKT